MNNEDTACWQDYLEQASFLVEHCYVDSDVIELAKKLYENDKDDE